MSVVVGVLTIDLKANTAAFSQSMDKMSALSAKTATDIKRSLERIGVAGVAMAGAIATGTVATIKGALESADAMSKMSQSVGTTVETLSVLQYAAGLSNVSTEELGKGLTKLSVAAFKAQNGNVALQRIFERVGVSATDANGRIKDSGVLMEQLAVKFSQMATSGGKTALVTQLFGRGAAALIPLLNQLGSEQEKVNDEAHRFGLVLSTSTGELAEKAHDNLDRLHLMLKGIGFSLLGAVLPALDELMARLVDLAKKADIPDLARSFGASVSTAIRDFGKAVEFAVTHVNLLKNALIALAAVKVGTIAIPLIADLAGGGLGKVAEGGSKFALSLLGISNAAKGLPKVAESIAKVSMEYYTMAQRRSLVGVVKMGAAEGFGGVGAGIGATVSALKGLSVASMFEKLSGVLKGIPKLFVAIAEGAWTASKALMLAALSNPWTLAAMAIIALVAVLYKFRDATFSLNGSTYKLRDTWNAAWIAMGWAVSAVGKAFKPLIDGIKSLWNGLINWFAQSSIVKVISGAFGEAFKWIQNMLGKLTPEWVGKALDQAKEERLAKVPGATGPSRASLLNRPATKGAPKPPPDTSGLGKQTESPVDKVLANLQEKLDEAKQSLAAAGMEEEAQRKVAAANKASQEIMKLGQEIAKQTGAATKDYASLVDDTTQALIREKNAQISDIDARIVLLNLIGAGSRASALSIAQSQLMTEAMDKGSDAVREQTARIQVWNELRAKGALATDLDARAAEVSAEMAAKEGLAIHGNIINLEQELAARKIVNDAILDSVDAQEEAALKAKLYALQVQIDTTAAGDLRNKLMALRATMIAINEEEKRKSDLENARKYDPVKEYEDQKKSIDDAEAALARFQNGMLTYGQSMQIAMARQENFNRLIDATVKGLLSQNNAANGVKAFFLDMQRQAITTSQIIYDALHSAFTKLSENLTQLVTGGKTSFAQMFTDIGRQMVNSTIQKSMQTGLAAIGKAFPALAGPLGNISNAMKGKPDGSQNNPFWVQMAAGGGMGGTGGGSQSNPISVVLGAAGIGSKGLSGTLGVGTGVMGTGVTTLDGLRDNKGIPGIPRIAGSGVGAFGADIRGDVGGLAVHDPTDLLGGWTPGAGEGDTGVGDVITGIGPDANDSESGAGDGGVGGAVGGLVSMLGGIFGGGKKTKPDGSKDNPLWVQMAGGGSLAGGSGGILDALGGTDKSGDGGSGGGGGGGFMGMLGGLFSGLFGKGKSGGGDSGGDSGGGGGIWGKLIQTVIGAFIPHAEGGPVSPSNAYLVGEKGPEILTGTSGNITSNAASRRLLGGSTGATHYYTIDARGTDPVLTEQRTRAAIMAAHTSAITNSVQVTADRLKRTPQK